VKAIVAYLPPRQRFNTDAFVSNLGRYRTRNKFIMVSDDKSWQVECCPDPEKARCGNSNAVNNLVFLMCLKVSIEMGVDTMLYLESDCRVNGHYWDQRVFNEYQQQGKPVAGTLFAVNPWNSGSLNAQRFAEWSNRNVNGIPTVTALGVMEPGRVAPAYCFPNGALGVYDVKFVWDLFRGEDLMIMAKEFQAWDREIGLRIANRYPGHEYDQQAALTSVYSGYGDACNTEAERLQWLHSGKVAAIHQVKGNVE